MAGLSLQFRAIHLTFQILQFNSFYISAFLAMLCAFHSAVTLFVSNHLHFLKWCACLHCFLHLEIWTFVQIPSLDLSHLTFLYVLMYAALVKNIFNLTLYQLQHSLHYLLITAFFVVISSPVRRKKTPNLAALPPRSNISVNQWEQLKTKPIWNLKLWKKYRGNRNSVIQII